MDTATEEVFYDKVTFIYLEMPKFTKTESELETLLDKWLYAIRNLASLMDRPRALQEKVFQHLFEAAELAKFDPKDRYAYEESLKNYRDWYSVMKTAEMKGHAAGHAAGLEEGRAEGRVEGRAEGAHEANLSIARNLKQMNFPISDIVKATGLTVDEITQL